jgi:hypothetical protein
VDYVGIIKQAWRVTRRSRALRELGAISASQLVVYSLAVGATLAPLALLPRFTAGLSAAEQGSVPPVGPLGMSGTRLLVDAGQAFLDYLPLIAGGLVILSALWVVLGILDVAAQAGMIAEVDGVLGSRTVDLRERMHEGFRMWWRVAGLSAVAAMPTLIMLLLIGFATTLTYTVPLMRGDLPDPATAMAGQLALVPLQGVVSVATTLLAVLVQVSLRSAVLEDMQWRESLRRGFSLVKANPGPVALTYLIVTAVATIVALCISLVAGVVLGVVAVLTISLAAASGGLLGALAAVIAVLAGLALTAGGVAVYSVFIGWASAVWTILWKILIAPRGGDSVAPSVEGVASTGTD